MKLLLYVLSVQHLLPQIVHGQAEFLAKFHQKDYKLNYERLQVVSFDKNYMKEFKIITYKYNRTLPVTNITFVFAVDVKNELEVVCQTYKFLSNEYRIFPVRFQLNFCALINSNIAGLKRFTDETIKCPIKKNVVNRIINFYPDESMLPPFIPNGQFKIDKTFLYLNKEIGFFQSYVTIYRPILPRD